MNAGGAAAKGSPRQISPLRAAAIVLAFTAYFYILLFTLRPFLTAHVRLNPALHWFITGCFLFVPLLAFAVRGARREGHRGPRAVLAALNVRPLGRRGWIAAAAGLLVAFAASAALFAASALLSRELGWRPLDTTPWFMEMRPFRGAERLLLLAWLPMFFFNIAGEELLWRGYVQARLPARAAWPLGSLLWLLFHLPFGLDLMLILVPVIVVIPYAFQRTRNTLVGVVIHALYNGPIFVAIAMGWAG